MRSAVRAAPIVEVAVIKPVTIVQQPIDTTVIAERECGE